MISNFCTFNGVRTGVMWICGWYARFVFGRVAWIRIRIRAFFAQRDPDPSKLTDPYGSGSVPRIRKILKKIEIYNKRYNNKKNFEFLIEFWTNFVFDDICLKNNSIESPLHYLTLKIFGYFEVSQQFFEIGRIRFGSGSVKYLTKGSRFGSVWFSRIRATLVFGHIFQFIRYQLHSLDAISELTRVLDDESLPLLHVPVVQDTYLCFIDIKQLFVVNLSKTKFFRSSIWISWVNFDPWGNWL